MNPFDIDDCLHAGWNAVRQRPTHLVSVSVLVMIVSIVPLDRMLTTDETPAMIKAVLFVIDRVVSILLSMGSVAFYLKAHDDLESSNLAHLWHPDGFSSFLGASALIVLCGMACAAIGAVPIVLLKDHFVLQILVGSVGALAVMGAMLRFMFALVIVIDRGLRPVAALRESMRLARGRGWQLAWLMMVIGAVDLMGLLFFGLGIFVAIPVTQLAWIHAYRSAMAMDDEPARAPAPLEAAA